MLANRSRGYLAGAGEGISLPLSVADVTKVTEAHPSHLPRKELDFYIFALDEEFLNSINGKPKPREPQDVEKAFDSLVSKLNRKVEDS